MVLSFEKERTKENFLGRKFLWLIFLFATRNEENKQLKGSATVPHYFANTPFGI